MGHSTGTSFSHENLLGMTANYTHTRLETKRRQLLTAMSQRPIAELCPRWLERVMTGTADVVANGS
jgi:hypothetical protein